MHQNLFDYHSKNLYKLGKSKNPKQRISSYNTCFPDDPIFVYVSEEIINVDLAEIMLFHTIKNYRYSNRKEFFNYPLDDIKQIIISIRDEINILFGTKSKSEFINKYIKKIKMINVFKDLDRINTQSPIKQIPIIPSLKFIYPKFSKLLKIANATQFNYYNL